MRKTIAIVSPCRNEQDNLIPLVEAIELVFECYLPDYDYTIQFMDNCSTDNSRTVLENLVSSHTRVRAIFNASNFPRSSFHGLLQARGDCCVYMASDFQDPPSLIPQLVAKWEQGAKVVCAQKESSEEKRTVWGVRSLYYKLIGAASSIEQIEHFTGFGLYDRDFIEVIRSLGDSTPTLRGVVAEYGYKIEIVPFVQPERRKGKSSQNFFSLFEYAMSNITAYSKIGIHLPLVISCIMLAVCLVLCFVTTICGASMGWTIDWAVASVMSLVSFFGFCSIAAVMFVGEYVANTNTRTMNKPYAVEEKRLGFGDESPLPEHVVCDSSPAQKPRGGAALKP